MKPLDCWMQRFAQGWQNQRVRAGKIGWLVAIRSYAASVNGALMNARRRLNYPEHRPKHSRIDLRGSEGNVVVSQFTGFRHWLPGRRSFGSRCGRLFASAAGTDELHVCGMDFESVPWLSVSVS